jgi:hypothetical protein
MTIKKNPRLRRLEDIENDLRAASGEVEEK